MQTFYNILKHMYLSDGRVRNRRRTNPTNIIFNYLRKIHLWTKVGDIAFTFSRRTIIHVSCINKIHLCLFSCAKYSWGRIMRVEISYPYSNLISTQSNLPNTHHSLDDDDDDDDCAYFPSALALWISDRDGLLSAR